LTMIERAVSVSRAQRWALGEVPSCALMFVLRGGGFGLPLVFAAVRNV
jgi:hypothetical protein